MTRRLYLALLVAYSACSFGILRLTWLDAGCRRSRST